MGRAHNGFSSLGRKNDPRNGGERVVLCASMPNNPSVRFFQQPVSGEDLTFESSPNRGFLAFSRWLSASDSVDSVGEEIQAIHSTASTNAPLPEPVRRRYSAPLRPVS